jgi:hypothetical protein
MLDKDKSDKSQDAASRLLIFLDFDFALVVSSSMAGCTSIINLHQNNPVPFYVAFRV